MGLRLPTAQAAVLLLFLLLLLPLSCDGQSWWANYKEGKPPEYLQPPWASAPGMEKTPLPAAPKPMPPPPPPPQGFQGTGRFYPPPPPHLFFFACS